MDGLDALLQGAWTSLGEPIYLGLFLALVMQLAGRSLIEGVRAFVLCILLKQPDYSLGADWDLRPLCTNLLAFGIGILITASFIGAEYSGGQAVYTAVLGAAAATQTYEALKNFLSPFGLKIPFGSKWQ